MARFRLKRMRTVDIGHDDGHKRILTLAVPATIGNIRPELG
jgi:hypothetical protein